MTPEGFVTLLGGSERAVLWRKDPSARRLLTRLNPQLFALTYLPHHLGGDLGQVSFSPMHLDWCQHARNWIRPVTEPRAARRAYVAPRDSGKSTWWFVILPLWAAAHGHKRLISAFADSATQAEMHLATFRRELETNQLLRQDFPEFCDLETSNRGQITTRSGFSFTARGVDSSSLGLKIGEYRPDLLLLDDVEPPESDYSLYQAKQRLLAITDSIFPMNERAHTVLVGTVTMVDSIIHQLIQVATAPDYDHPAWIEAERVKVHYYPPIVTGEGGEQASIWPEKWSLDYLLSIQHTRSYAKNFLNQPISEDGAWWRPEDIRYQVGSGYERIVMVVDGAVTTKKTSDYTGVSIVGLNVARRKFYVREALALKLAGEQLRERVIDLAEAYGVNYILVESNQGGDLWYTVFHDMPVPVKTFTQKERKEVRIRRLLAAYQRDSGSVLHEKPLPDLENQQRAYPNVLHEDVLDSVAANVEHLVHMLLRKLGRGGTNPSVKQYSYV